MADITKLSVFDPRIIQERPAFAVDKGALSLTNSPFSAIAATSSQMSFNVQVPSLNVFIDREVEWTTGVRFATSVAVAGAADPANTGQPVLVLGRDAALAPYPLHSLVSTMTATINDAVTTINTADVLYEIVRLIDRKENRLIKTSPQMLDKYQNYNDAVGAINNPLASYFDSTDYDNVPNGAFYNIFFTDSAGAVLSGNGSYVSGGVTVQQVNGVPVLDTGGAGINKTYPLFFQATLNEQLILSPFIFNEECGNEVGLYGVNNIQFIFNFGSQQISRLLRSATSANSPITRTLTTTFNTTASDVWVNPRINIRFLTPSLDVALPPKSILPYLEYPRYIQSYSSTIPAAVSGVAGRLSSQSSQTITLPQIPDMLVIYAKPRPQDLTNGVADYYFPITRLSVNFDNFAGLLSTMTTQQLYDMSVKNGLEMDWNTWNGQGRVTQPSVVSGVNRPLVGGFLVLKMGKDITLQAGQAPSVVGNYTLQFDFDVVNPTSSPVANWNLQVMTINSGYFETQSGSSRIIKGVLTEQDVISAPLAPEPSRSKMERMVGGGFLSKLGTALSKASKVAMDVAKDPAVRQIAKAGVKKFGGERGRQAVEVAEALGMGVSGGGRTGGGRTGGRMANLSALM